ncbi:FdhF/YdeP family oxidoreductase [Horticoccus sp. 23ND18S-11]|uniref:FdhF/YdeP family oxidoreductase n=1 Tax=Horticoccus sp. 23ND18S-11 TaxID=3391832 RepID=UPI0039C8F7ED
MAEPATPSALTPRETPPPHLAAPSAAAAGLKAVGKTAQLVGGMGVTRGVRALLQVNQSNGFDCQSCAWPSPDRDRHVFEFCENGAKAVADEATPKRVDREFFARHAVADLARESDFWLNAQGRLAEPMVLEPGATHYTPIAWDEAFARIARELRALPTPDAAAFYTSGRTSNEAAFLWQLFARQFGTNNLPDCSNMCHESSGVALGESIGIGKGTVKLDDFDHADAIFVIGQNPGTNHPRMLAALESARARGAKIVSINPLPEIGIERFKNPQDFLNPLKAFKTLLGDGARLSDLWVQPRIAGDLAVFKGLMKAMLEAEDAKPGTVFDHEFIREHTQGFAALEADLHATPWNDILAASGVDLAVIQAAAAIAMASRATICCWAMGLTQQPEAVATIQQVVNFLLLRGSIGRRGAGVCPVRGHSNVQGDRTMGICERMPEAWLARLDAEFGLKSPRAHGLDTVGTIRAMHEGAVRVFVAMGGNFLSATPDTAFTAEALRRCTLTAQVATKLNRSHLVTGRSALILPCLGRSERDLQDGGEQFVTTEDSMGIINSSRGQLEPASAWLLSEPAVVCRLAQAVFAGDDVRAGAIPWDALAGNYDLIRDRIARVVPGFEDYNQRVREGPFYLPNAPRDTRKWKTRTDRANFVVAPIPRGTLAPGEFVMMTIRTHDQFNTTVYGLDDRYRGVFGGRRVVFMHEADIAAAGLQGGQLVDLTNRHGGVERVAPAFMVAPYRIPRGCVATYFPEANVLVPIDSVAARSNTPTSKYVIVTIVAAKA